MIPRYCITTATPPTFPLYRGFDDVAFSLYAAMRRLGRDVVMTRGEYKPGRQHIVLGANLLVHPSFASLAPPPDSILYNLEQVFPGSQWWPREACEFFSRYPVWDYARQNIEQLRAWGIEARYVPLGYVPELTRIAPAAEEDIDVLFVGSMNERRAAIVHQIRGLGIRVEVPHEVYGEARDKLYARTKINLNLHYYEARVFEQARVLYLLANNRFVISESGCDPEEEKPFEPAAAFVPYDSLVTTVQWYLAHPAERLRKGALGSSTFSVRDLPALLDPVLHALETHRTRPMTASPFPVYINVRNRLAPLPGLLRDIARLGGKPVIVDNDSTYPPLLAFYATNPFEIVFLRQNLGVRAVWMAGLALREPGYYAVTDGDLDLSRVPDDGLAYLTRGFQAHPTVTKAGFSLELGDLPDNEITRKVRNHEAQFWTEPLGDGFYRASVDTTFALYHTRRDVNQAFFAAVRSDRPYTARHLPWYEDVLSPSEEEMYYQAHASSESFWGMSMKEYRLYDPATALQQQYDKAAHTPSDINEHLPTLRSLAERCDHVTEMGTRSAVSTSALLAAQPKKLICYDLQRSAAVSDLLRIAGKTDMTFHQADVLQVDIEETDLLFIDTYHVYSQLQNELALHAGKARRFIALHDTTIFGEVGETPGHKGLWPAVTEFLVAHPEWTLLHRYENNNGLTVLSRVASS